jgi:hypothetical protein
MFPAFEYRVLTTASHIEFKTTESADMVRWNESFHRPSFSYPSVSRSLASLSLSFCLPTCAHDCALSQQPPLLTLVAPSVQVVAEYVATLSQLADFVSTHGPDLCTALDQVQQEAPHLLGTQGMLEYFTRVVELDSVTEFTDRLNMYDLAHTSTPLCPSLPAHAPLRWC